MFVIIDSVTRGAFASSYLQFGTVVATLSFELFISFRQNYVIISGELNFVQVMIHSISSLNYIFVIKMLNVTIEP